MVQFSSFSASLFGQATGLTGTIFQRGGATSAGDPLGALARAEKGRAKQIADAADQPQVARELERFEKAVKGAKSVEDLLKNRDAMRVILTANGLGTQIDAQGLVRRALTSKLNDPKAVVYQLARTNGNWLTTARDLDLDRKGLQVVQSDVMIARLKIGYAQAKWEDSLEQQAPGLSLAVIFKRRAASIDSPLKVLGDPVAREVVTATLGIPKDLARQSVEAQERAIAAKIDVSKFKDERFLDNFIKRYLLTVNTGLGNLNTFA